MAAFTKEELMEKYRNFTTGKLQEIAASPADYTPEAIAAVNELLAGRKDLFESREEDKNAPDIRQAIAKETRQLAPQIKNLFKAGLNDEEIHAQIPAGPYGRVRTKEIVDALLKRLHQKRENQKITNRTIGGCVVGGLVGFSIGAVITYFIERKGQIGNAAAFVYGAFFLINFVCIYLITRQSLKNKLILILSLSLPPFSFVTGLLMVEYLN